jgi:hypothetical protein
MKKINIQRWFYQFQHKYLTLNNIVLAIGLVVAAGWVWGSLSVMQRNYNLQKELDDKSRQLVLAQLDTENAKLEQNYYHTEEYQELAVRQQLGLGTPGESVLILPPNSAAVETASKKTVTIESSTKPVAETNLKQWLDFLFGNNSRRLTN